SAAVGVCGAADCWGAGAGAGSLTAGVGVEGATAPAAGSTGCNGASGVAGTGAGASGAVGARATPPLVSGGTMAGTTTGVATWPSSGTGVSNSMGTMMTAANTSASAPISRRRARPRNSLACASLDNDERDAARRPVPEAGSLRENNPMGQTTYLEKQAGHEA